MSGKGSPSRSRPCYVLDSFALLVWLQDDPGADTVQSLIESAEKNRALIYVSWINIAEVYYIVKRRSLEANPQLAADRVVEAIENLPIHIEPVAKPEAIAAARFKSEHALSLANAFAAALANARGARVVTGDPEFEPLRRANGVSIHWLPAKSKSK